MKPKKLYWKLREIVRHPKSEFYLPTARVLARLPHLAPGLWSRFSLRRLGIVRIPPAPLRYRVHGDNSLYGFLNTGRRCSENITSAVQRTGRTFASFENILDFGCGCGRTLLHFAHHGQQVNFYGTDIDAEAISWCQHNYNFGSFAVNESLPPLSYPDKRFDLVYAISVFTHINEEQQLRWLSEFKRVIANNGILLITVHGEHTWQSLPAALVAQLKQTGLLFISDAVWKDIFPDWYQTTYHTKEYVLDTFSKYFKILDYIPRGINRHQDLVVLQNEE